MQKKYRDIDPEETKEWEDALYAVLQHHGHERAQFLVNQLFARLRELNINITQLNTPYRNTIPLSEEPAFAADLALEERISNMIRWNAALMVLKAGKIDPDLGGHIGTYASCATLYDVGFNHFWRGMDHTSGGDLIFFQGHSSPGIYARAYLEGRLSTEQLLYFRREVDGKGVSSYPHPWLMPDFWQFPTVSMGLGPLQAIYQARFLRYLIQRQLLKPTDRKVWCFCGDGEMDEPESQGTLSLAGREKLDNLIFVINCNLQRLDGPVRGNSSIIQELESIFLGCGWNVIKVIWDSNWDKLFAKDNKGLLLQRMAELVDGDYQNLTAKGGAYIREHFFGKDPELLAMVADLTDEEISALNRGGHDSKKIYAAYAKAIQHTGSPTVILVKSVKGYGLGSAGESQNIAHNAKKMTIDQVKAFRDRFQLPLSDENVNNLDFIQFDASSPERRYLEAVRSKLGGNIPRRRRSTSEKLAFPALDFFNAQLAETPEGRKISTTMAFVRIISNLTKDPHIGSRIVPIVPDEARTFGMEGLFRQVGIYAPQGQLYTPVDSEQVMYYKEASDGQILQEGLNEAGAFCSWLAAATSYSVNDLIMIPFYIYYSMFGFQRIGDLAWAAGDSRAKGFLIGATSGRTTLNGEGLQHEDGHSHIMASTIPNCISYDPTFSYELAVIIHAGFKRMYIDNEDVFFYITTMNENYNHPKMPEGSYDGIVRGMYLLQESDLQGASDRVQLLGSGSILNEVIAAANLLKEDFAIAADIWSVPSFNEIARDGNDKLKANRLQPKTAAVKPYVTELLEKTRGPIIAATDYMKQYAGQIYPFIPEGRQYVVLGTDGFGRSDTRAKLREFFEVSRYHIVLAALRALVEDGKLKMDTLNKAVKKYGISV